MLLLNVTEIGLDLIVGKYGLQLLYGSRVANLKNELIHHQRYATRTDAQAAVQEYIESFYNRQRRHSRLGYIPPVLFADNFNQQSQIA